MKVQDTLSEPPADEESGLSIEPSAETTKPTASDLTDIDASIAKDKEDVPATGMKMEPFAISRYVLVSRLLL